MYAILTLMLLLTPALSRADQFTLTSGTWQVGEAGHIVMDLTGPNFHVREVDSGAFSHGPGVLLPTDASPRPAPARGD